MKIIRLITEYFEITRYLAGFKVTEYVWKVHYFSQHSWILCNIHNNTVTHTNQIAQTRGLHVGVSSFESEINFDLCLNENVLCDLSGKQILHGTVCTKCRSRAEILIIWQIFLLKTASLSLV